MLAAQQEATGPLIVGVGGSASTDGGTGAAVAWGWRFLDEDGRELPPGGAALPDLVHIEPPEQLPSIELLAACDVDNPLVGKDGAARVFGPQKGADPECVERLEMGLSRLAEVVRTEIGRDVSEVAHGGAGGGIGAGLVAFFGATLRPGLDSLAEASGLESEIAAADLVITGEGRMDRSSLNGKAPVSIARIAQRTGTPCLAIAGDLQLGKQQLKKAGIDDAVGLMQTGGGSLAGSDPERAIEKATEGLLRIREEKGEGRSFRRRRSFPS